MSTRIITIAFDDIDNRIGGCTTHFTSLFLLHILDKIDYLADYPLLVRLNPAIPWKTRGNASTALRIYTRASPEEVLDDAITLAEEYIQGRPAYSGKTPGIVVAEGRVWENPMARELYKSALTGVVDPGRAESVLRGLGALYWGGRGIVGAAAALGALGPGDPYTFETIVYRRPDTWGSKRCINWSNLDEGNQPSYAFNNTDYVDGKPAFSPGGYDPILAGFRGYRPVDPPWNAFCEKPGLAVIFRTNQHTGQHNTPISTPRFTPYSTGSITATITGDPEVLPKGHTIVEATVEGSTVDLVFFRETWPLNIIARRLIPGDTISAIVHVKPYQARRRPVLAVEHLYIVHATRREVELNPRCMVCGSSMASIGRGGGYKCKACGFSSRSLRKLKAWIPRDVAGGAYTVRPGRYPHLSPPRYNMAPDWIDLPLRLDPKTCISQPR